MKLPQLTAERSLMSSIGSYGSNLSPVRRVGGLAPMVDIGCLQDCVGADTAAYCLRCGGDMDCWENCAGEGSRPCVEPCYRQG